MTKNEFIQEAALRLITAWAGCSFASENVADAAKQIADEVWKLFDDEQPAEPQVLAMVPDNEPIQTLAKEIARLETLELQAKRAHYNTTYYQKGGLDIRFLNVCKFGCDREIDTVKDLIDFGRHEFSSLRNIGPHTMKLVDQAIENLYNIKSW